MTINLDALPKLDIGCGPNKKEGHVGVDQFDFPGVDVKLVFDGTGVWPWPDNSIGEVHCSHFLEHLGAVDRTHFLNELFRVLAPGAKATIIVPAWSSSRAYGDPTHQWPPIGEMFFFYLMRGWREQNAPHTDQRWNPQGYNCDFQYGAAHTMHPELQTRNEEMQHWMLSFCKESALDIVATLIKPQPAPDFT